MDSITILLVEDHQLVAEAWTMILNDDQRFWVIGKTACPTEALHIVKQMTPRIALVDINMSPVNGFQITKQIKALESITKVIGVSIHNNCGYARKMMQTGASGYVTKNSSKDELMTAIIEVDKGNKYICLEIKDLLSNELLMEDTQPAKHAGLTKRELEVVYAITAGLSSREIGAKLNISLKTAEVHRYNILKKLNLRNTAALVNYVNTEKVL